MLNIELILDFSRGESANATTNRCSNSHIAIGPDSSFSAALGAKPFSKSFALGKLKFALEDALADASFSMAITNATDSDLRADFCSLSSLSSLKSFVSAIPWDAQGSFVLISKLGVSLGPGIAVKPVISVENPNMFDDAVSTSFNVDFDLNDLDDLKDVIRNVLTKISAGLQQVFERANTKLNGENINLSSTLQGGDPASALPDFEILFRDFFTLFSSITSVKKKVQDEVGGVVDTEAANAVFGSWLHDALDENTELYLAIVRVMQKLDVGFLQRVLGAFDLDLMRPNDKGAGTKDAKAEKIKFLLSALGFGPQKTPGFVSVVSDDVELSVELPPTEDGKPGAVNTAKVFSKLRAVQFPTIRALLAFLNDVAIPSKTIQAGPFSLEASFKNQVLQIVLGVDWALSGNELLSTLSTEMKSITATQQRNPENKFICDEFENSKMCDNVLDFDDPSLRASFVVDPSVQATVTATLDLNPYIHTGTAPHFTLELNHAAVRIEASLESFNLPIVNSPYFGISQGNLHLLLGTEVHNATMFDSAKADAKPTDLTTQVSTGSALVQAAGNFYGSFDVELPFKIGNPGGLLITVGISNDDVRKGLQNTKFELMAEITMPLVQTLRDKLLDVSTKGRAINAMPALNRKLPVLGVSFNQLFLKAAPQFERQGWGDFLIWDTVFDKLLDDIQSCAVRQDTIMQACKVKISDLVRRFKNHAVELLTVPNFHFSGNVGGKKASLSAGFDATVRVRLDPSWGEIFDNLPIKLRAAASLDLVLAVKGGFDFSADQPTSDTVRNVKFVARPFEVSLQVDASVDLQVIFGIVEGSAVGRLNMKMEFVHGSDGSSSFAGAAGADLEIDASLNGVAISDASEKPAVAIDVPDLSNPTDLSVMFTGFTRLRDMIQLTPENLLLMLRALDKFLQDYTNTTLFQAKIPMLDITLKDILDFTAGFEQRISARLKEPRPVKDRLKKELVLESEAFLFPYHASASSSFKLSLDDDVVNFDPFDVDESFADAASLVSHLNGALQDAELANRMAFAYDADEMALQLKTTPNSILVLLRLESGLAEELVDSLTDANYTNFTLREKEAYQQTQEEQVLQPLMLYFPHGVEDVIPTEPAFTTWLVTERSMRVCICVSVCACMCLSVCE